MSIEIRDLKGQSEIVIKQLMMRGCSRERAVRLWYTSKTKKELEDRKLFYVSGIRCFVELMYELDGNDSKWMRDPFDM